MAKRDYFARFWNKVDLPDNATDEDCWLWIGGNRESYGKFWYNGKQRLVHRFVYELYRGAAPENLNVCHSCDCPACVNPSHLFLGDDIANFKDACQKGRKFRKLDHESVRQMRKLIADGIDTAKIASRFKVSTATVRQYATGKLGRWIA